MPILRQSTPSIMPGYAHVEYVNYGSIWCPWVRPSTAFQSTPQLDYLNAILNILNPRQGRVSIAQVLEIPKGALWVTNMDNPYVPEVMRFIKFAMEVWEKSEDWVSAVIISKNGYKQIQRMQPLFDKHYPVEFITDCSEDTEQPETEDSTANKEVPKELIQECEKEMDKLLTIYGVI